MRNDQHIVELKMEKNSANKGDFKIALFFGFFRALMRSSDSSSNTITILWNKKS